MPPKRLLPLGILLGISLFVIMVGGRLLVPRTTTQEYIKEGDILLGVLMNVHKDGGMSANRCSDVYDTFSLHDLAALEFAISEVNSKSPLLTNLTLGYIVKDACDRDINALARAIYFVEDHQPTCNSKNVTWAEDISQWPAPRKVVGLIGTPTSRQAVLVASFASIFELPVLGTLPSSDELKDKSRFEYLLRLVPSDGATVSALVDVARHFEWSYVSVIYTDGSYGEFGFKAIMKETKRHAICLASTFRLSSDSGDAEYERAFKSLENSPKAKVVIVFGEEGLIRAFFNFLQREKNVLNKVFLGGSSTCGLGSYPDTVKAAQGLICVGYKVDVPAGFGDFYQQYRPTESRPHWLRGIWAQTFNCSWAPVTNNCNNDNYKTSSEWRRLGIFSGKMHDAVNLYAHALHNLIDSKCSLTKPTTSELTDCITGPHLLAEMKNVSFQGVSSWLKFDEDGELLAHFLIKQICADGIRNVGEWNQDEKTNGSLTIYREQIQLWGNASVGNVTIPKSFCSTPCGKSHFKIQGETRCCWSCHRCSYNEILKPNGTGCDRCPPYFWPNDENSTVCEEIEHTYLSIGEPVANVLTCLAGFGIMKSMLVLLVMVMKRRHRLVKAANRQLSCIMLIGAAVSCLVVISYIVRPTKVTCMVRQTGFHLAMNLLYGPIFVKTFRIHRIFLASKRGINKPTFVTEMCQLVSTCVVIGTQIAILSTLALIYTPAPELRMPIPSEKYVEATCRLKLTFFLTPLIYNSLLICACAVLGFLTRKFPDNFNESWFIFVSISTTLFLWVVFLPAYFISTYSYYQAICIGFCLILNAYITVMLLFLPKIYAIFYVDDSSNFGILASQTGISQCQPGLAMATLPTRVAPAPSQSGIVLNRNESILESIDE